MSDEVTLRRISDLERFQENHYQETQSHSRILEQVLGRLDTIQQTLTHIQIQNGQFIDRFDRLEKRIRFVED